MVRMVDQMAAMSDEQVANLRENAERLATSGTPTQVSAAAELLPAVLIEVSRRKDARKSAQAAARSATRKARIASLAPAVQAEA